LRPDLLAGFFVVGDTIFVSARSLPGRITSAAIFLKLSGPISFADLLGGVRAGRTGTLSHRTAGYPW
jgi:hypothetical protein